MIRLLVILSAACGASIDPAEHRSVVYQCGFETASDANYDRWPDGWTRQTGRDYPAYVKIAIADESPANRCLRVELDGGSAAAYSPAIPVVPRFNYVLSGRVRTERLEHDLARVTLTFYDAERNPIGATLVSPEVRDAAEWRDLRIDVEMPDDDRIAQAVIGLHLRPGGDGKADLFGSAEFDDVTLARMPRMELKGNAPFHIFHQADKVAIECRVSGVAASQARLKLELLDIDNRSLVDETIDMAGRRISSPAARIDSSRSVPGMANDLPEAYAAVKTWRPAVPDYGFYRVRASLFDGGDALLTRETTLVVLRPIRRATSGPFGWSLRQQRHTASLEQLSELLPTAGVHWVKFPLWRTPYEIADDDRAATANVASHRSPKSAAEKTRWTDRFSRFCERLAMEHIEVVAVLDQPPAALRERFPDDGPLPVASVFLDPAMWSEAIDPAAADYSLKIRWWQLGADDDASFIGIPKLAETITGIQLRMEQFGQQVKLGFAVGWSVPPPANQTERPPWAFLSLEDDPSAPAEALEARLGAGRDPGVDRWITLTPAPGDRHDVQTRTRELVRRMLAARIAGVQCIYLDEPFHPEHGLFDESRLPRELLLPWRTAADFLAGAEHLGSITLPSGSRNFVFARGQEALMVVWNDQPTSEVLYLGEAVEQVDVWGRGKTLTQDGHRQVVPVGPTPTFLLGLNLPVARWRTAVEFESDRLEGIFGRSQTARYRFRNTFDRAVTGGVELRVPDVWQIEPRRSNIALDAGAEQKSEFEIFLGADAGSGPQPVRVDFTVEADRTYEFSVYRTVHVGLGDIEIEISSQLDERGALVVRQRFINHTDREVSFNCMLFAPGRRRERVQVVRQGRGDNVATFVLDRGEQLVGHTLWLRAEEIGGERILNYSLVATE